MCMLRDPRTGDYSIIVETKDATAPQTVRITLPKGLSRNSLCVWLSNEREQFVRQGDLSPRGGTLTLDLESGSVYSFSTTRGQVKGAFEDIPSSKAFPFPYEDTFEQYTRPEDYGYLPHYLADLIGCFELTQRPDHRGRCIRQTVSEHTLSWAPEWHHYTILGDVQWQDYEVSADVYLNPGDEAGVMGRLCDVGSGYGIWAKGYYLKLDDRGKCTLVLTRGRPNPREPIGDAEQQAAILARKDVERGGEYTLAEVTLPSVSACQWRNLRLRFEGDTVTGYVDGEEVLQAESGHYTHGMAGLVAPLQEKKVSTPYFDNLRVVPL